MFGGKKEVDIDKHRCMAGNVAKLSLLVPLYRSFLVSITTPLLFAGLVFYFKVSFISAMKKIKCKCNSNQFLSLITKQGL